MSNKNMSDLLPKLRKTHIQANIMLTGRQEKIMAILKGDKLNPQLNNGTSRKFFRQGSNMSSAGADLMAVNSQKFMAGSNAFITGLGTPERTRRNEGSMLQTSFKKRQGSVNPTLPTLDFTSQNDDAMKSRFMNRTIDPEGKNMNSAHVTSNQKILGNKDQSIQNLQIPNGAINLPRD